MLDDYEGIVQTNDERYAAKLNIWLAGPANTTEKLGAKLEA